MALTSGQYNILGEVLDDLTTASNYQDEPNPFDVSGLSGMSNLGEWEQYMGGWQTAEGKKDIMSEFGLQHGYQTYVTGFQETPFDMLKSQALASLDKQSYENMKSFSGAASKIGSARAQTGMAYSGEVEGSYDRALNQAMSDRSFSKQAVTKQWEKERFTEQQSQMDAFYSDIQAALGAQTSIRAAQIAASGQQKSGGLCVVTTALNSTGAWTDEQKNLAVDWCKENHHDGSERGRVWVDGYHTWGKFISKMVKKSKLMRFISNIATDAFIDLEKRNKPTFFGYVIKYGWINSMSYIIGLSRKNKTLGKIVAPLTIGGFVLMIPLFALTGLPHFIKKRGEWK